MEWLQVTTADGHVLDADLAETTDATAGVVVCHPHPQYGGSRFDQVVTSLVTTLPTLGIAALRFDFRRAYGGGVDERLDAMAALEVLAERLPGRPLHLVGYSFGAMVALSTEHPMIATRVAIAPPLPADPALASAGPPSGPTLVIVPEHDQFCPPAEAGPVVATWPESSFDTVSMADHFLAGRSAAVTELVGRWVLDDTRPSSSRIT